MCCALQSYTCTTPKTNNLRPAFPPPRYSLLLRGAINKTPQVPEASARGIPVGNTPGVLTETTAELAAALTLAAARRVPEADVFMRSGQYKGWLPTLFVGQLLQNKTVGIVGAGRIGAAYARMMVEGHKMNLVYFDPYPNAKLEEYIR